MLKRKDVPQWISAKDDLHKHDLHNVVAVTKAQATLTQGERRRTIGFKRGLCNFRSLIYNDNNIGFLKLTDVNINYVTSVIIKPMLTSTR